MKTIKELADELGVSKTAVMKKIDNRQPKTANQIDNRRAACCARIREGSASASRHRPKGRCSSYRRRSRGKGSQQEVVAVLEVATAASSLAD